MNTDYTAFVISPETTATNVEELATEILRMQEKAIWIPSIGIRVNCHGQEDYLYPSSSLFKYDYNSGVISWTNPTGMYAIPSMGNYDSVLFHAGYVKGLWVPFSNGDYPVEFREKWAQLCAERNYQNKLEALSSIAAYSNEKSLTAIPSWIVHKYLMEIPPIGLEYYHCDKKKRYSPVFVSQHTTHEYLGTYWIQGNIVIVVDYLGTSFVGRFCEDVRKALEGCGYTSKEQKVPFYGDVTFVDEWFQNRWNILINDCESKA